MAKQINELYGMSGSIAISETLTILHVEDSDADAKLIEITLKQDKLYNYSLSRVSSIEEAIVYLNAQKVDLVLLDLFLPDTQGLDTLKRIRTFSPKTAIVVITGTDDEQCALQAVQNGAQDYLVKDELTARTMARAIRYSVERHKHDQQVIDLANTDMLTGLANRSRFMDYLEQAINSVQRLHYNLAILFIDCDHFKLINDTYGHAKGDEFLIALSKNLSSVLRVSDFAARLAGDEFVIALQSKNDSLRSPLTVAEKILSNIREGIYLSSGENLDARCSIGITNFSGEGDPPSPDKLLNEADTAMYLSKQRGGDCVSFFDQDLEKKAERRLQLLRDMAHAFREGEFYLNYQPIVNAKTKEFCGLETLLRWRSARGEIISPSEFIPLLEENGYIQTIGNWIIKQACLDYLALVSKGILDSSSWLSINISPIQLQAKHFFRKLEATILNSGINPAILHLEITESLLMEKSDHVLSILNQVKGLGCKWAIDDFGMGYSSMSYLKNLPIDILKIDKSFILNCCEDRQDCAITKAMISLAHNLGMDVVAEGVETYEASNMLSGECCDFLQGFYYGKPMAVEDLSCFLEDSKSYLYPREALKSFD